MSTNAGLPRVAWIKSSYSNADGGGCIEWAPAATPLTGIVPVRDSKDPHGPTLAFPTASFAAFVSAVKAGEFGTL
ncbi:hypothetical protein P3T37_002422 [Kitasatospora sp. MAA4]|uniref:DUF397 domain-containing protein n=1 Tax=Kitasatospora sp. MAA4 TaxID=3035093 RepID=UPI002473B385|nr:DUF397 domain-containing protein [Kitasatospora sp. MAA4]MDH6133028.1 hypothetical protein [Kitasatospora sp. MAA4]